jgi:hypothetical protein
MGGGGWQAVDGGRQEIPKGAETRMNTGLKRLRGRSSRPLSLLPVMAYFFFAAFFAAFFAGFFAAFFVAILSILPFRCLHRSLQHEMLQLTNV